MTTGGGVPVSPAFSRPALLVVASLGLPVLGCGSGADPERPAPPRPVPTLTLRTAAAEPAPAADARPLLSVPPPSAGLRLTLAPNLPGVEDADLPLVAQRQVEVVSYERGILRLRWTGLVKVEKPESRKRREEWVRARANTAPEKKPPATPGPAEYEDREVGGTLTFPDTRTARRLVLPGLWPEGDVTIREATALWLPEKAERDLVEAGLAHVPLLTESPSLTGPAAMLLARATAMMDEEAGKDPSASPPDLWRIASPSCRVPVRVSGHDGDVDAIRATNWFGSYEIVSKAEGSLVLSVLPSPPSSPTFDLFSPGNVLRTMLGYRVVEIEAP